MKNKKQWILWLIKTLSISTVMSFFAMFFAALLTRLVKGMELDLVGLIGPSLSFSWRLGIIVTVVAVALVLIGSLSNSTSKQPGEKISQDD
ncbi:hypothetical protein [Pseudomonas argentinensis]|uniref:hypothetical protein n=1 Tax=Phytopseudomonas argentinensis TaxID=289370 RepID=UPI0011146968|nr:hypothetical protein [Pseudomonas argentinensis]